MGLEVSFVWLVGCESKGPWQPSMRRIETNEPYPWSLSLEVVRGGGAGLSDASLRIKGNPSLKRPTARMAPVPTSRAPLSRPARLWRAESPTFFALVLKPAKLSRAGFMFYCCCFQCTTEQQHF